MQPARDSATQQFLQHYLLQLWSAMVDVNPMVILNAEDHEDVRLALANLLKVSGFTVLAAGDGISATGSLSQLSRHN